MGEAILRNLKTKTGKSIDEWIVEINTKNLPQTNKELSKTLKEVYNIGHFQARKISEEYLNINEYKDDETLIHNQFSKRQLDIFESIKSYILGLGEDVIMKPCKTYVPFSRKTQFVAISSLNTGIIIAIHLNNSQCEGFENKVFSGSPKLNFQCKIQDKTDFNDLVKNGVKFAFDKNV